MHHFSFVVSMSALSITCLLFTRPVKSYQAANQANHTKDEQVRDNHVSNLLQHFNNYPYNKYSIPHTHDGKPLTVKVGIQLIHAGNFQDSSQEFKVEMYFRQYWSDPRLTYTEPNETVTISGDELNFIWQPDTYFETSASSEFHKVTVLNKYVRMNPNGAILTSARLTMKSICPMNFRNFPLDRQICNISLASYGFTNRQLTYEWSEEKVVWDNEEYIAQFSLKNISYLNGTRTYSTGKFSFLGIRFYFMRRIGHYMTRVYVPASLIVCLSWLSFFVDKNSVPARVSLGITTVLTMTTLLIGVGQGSVPAVSYIKAVDWYLIVCYILVFSAFAEYAIVNYNYKRSKQVDEIPIATKYTPYLHQDSAPTRSNFNKVQPAANADIEQDFWHSGDRFRRHSFSSYFSFTSSTFVNLDKWSKRCFPLIFVIFNIVYWMYYVYLNDGYEI